MKLYSAYKKKLYAPGGFLGMGTEKDWDPENPVAGGIGIGAGIGQGAIDAFANRDPVTGRQSVGASAGKGALSGAAMGAKVAGPYGAAAGAVIGGAVGLISGFTERKAARAAYAAESGDTLQRERELGGIRAQGDTSLYQGYRNAGYFAGGGNLGPGPTVPVYKTQSDVDGANSFARSFMTRRYGNQLAINPDNITVASKPGDPQVRFVDPSGRDITGQPAQARKLLFSLPSGVTRDMVKQHNGEAWFDDPHTGDAVFVAPSVLAGKRQLTTDVARMATGGKLSAPLAMAYMNGGRFKSLSSSNGEFKGPSHEEGGIQLPELGAEVEGKETTAESFVFSRRLGFADQHRPIVKMKGIIEDKPATRERINSMRSLQERENKLAQQQEQFKQSLGLQ